MRKIVGIIQPFDKTQNIYVYENNNKIAATTPALGEIVTTILDLADEYDLTEVSLLGSKQYNKGVAKQLEKAEMTKYGKNILNITY